MNCRDNNIIYKIRYTLQLPMIDIINPLYYYYIYALIRAKSRNNIYIHGSHMLCFPVEYCMRQAAVGIMPFHSAVQCFAQRSGHHYSDACAALTGLSRAVCSAQQTAVRAAVH